MASAEAGISLPDAPLRGDKMKKAISIAVSLSVLMLCAACGNQDPQAKLADLTDRVCKTMKLIGYNFEESAIQSLDQSMQDQLMSDISEIKKLAPSLLNRPLEELCAG